MKEDILNIAVTQMNSVDDVNSNLKQMESLVKSAKALGQVDLVCFPENCLYMRICEGERPHEFSLSDSEFSTLSALAIEHHVDLHLGSLPLKIGNKFFNSSVWIRADGKIASGYQKIHLFDIELTGQKAHRESDIFERGNEPVISQFADWKIGESICYDLRFAELYNFYAKNKVDFIFIPAAFLVATGKVHWEVLLRARAIENQCYVVASAQVGHHHSTKQVGAERFTYGHAMVVNPWGEVILNMKEDMGVQLVSLKKSEILNVRRQIPMANHRKL